MHSPGRTHTPHFLYHISTVDSLVCCLHLCKVIFSCHLCCDFFPVPSNEGRSSAPNTACLPFPVCFTLVAFLLVFTSALLSSQSTLTSEATIPGTLPALTSKPSHFSQLINARTTGTYTILQPRCAQVSTATASKARV